MQIREKKIFLNVISTSAKEKKITDATYQNVIKLVQSARF
jgi:hypothetical protein